MRTKECYPKTKHLAKYVPQVRPEIVEMAEKLSTDALFVNDADREARAQLYREWASAAPVEDRIALVGDLAARFARFMAPLQALHPILCADFDPRVSERAAYELARFHWLIDGDLATGPRVVIEMARISRRDAKLSAGMLAGVLRLGDDVAAGVLRGARPLLGDSEHLRIFLDLFVAYVSNEHSAPYASLDLLVEWLEQATADRDEKAACAIADALCRIARAFGSATIVERKRRYPTPPVWMALKGYSESRSKARTHHRKFGRRITSLGSTLKDVAATWRESLVLVADDGDDWKAELAKERALPKQTKTDVGSSPAIAAAGSMSRLLRSKCMTSDDRERAELLAVYGEWARHQDILHRVAVVLNAMMAIEGGYGNGFELLPVIYSDPAPNVVANAARVHGVGLQTSLENGAVGALESLIGVARSLEGHPLSCAAVLSVLLRPGDFNITDSLDGTWRLLDGPARAWLLSRCFAYSEFPTTTDIEYLVAWLADAVDRRVAVEVESVARALADLSGCCSVDECAVWLQFPQHGSHYRHELRTWMPGEYYAERLAERLGEVVERAAALVGEEWSVAREAVLRAAESWRAQSGHAETTDAVLTLGERGHNG